MKGRTNNPFGRPRKGTDRQTVMVRIEKRHIELLRIYAERRRCLDPMGELYDCFSLYRRTENRATAQMK